MASQRDSITEAVTNLLGTLIRTDLQAMEGERFNPGFDPDRMDDIIKARRERAQELRVLRATFEDIMARPL